MPYFRIFALLRAPKTFSIACSSITLVLFAITILSGHARATESETKRVLAIGGAVTEIIYALGQEDKLVGRDSTSLYPQEATSLPDVGYIRALSPEGVLSVKPDLILARDNNGPKEAVDVIKSTGIKWVNVPDNFTIQGIDDNIRIIAEALGVTDKGNILRAKVASEVAEARKSLDTDKTKPKVMFVLSLQDGKINASGTKTAAHGIIELSGGENVISEFEGYKQLSDEAVIEAAPEMIVMMNGRGDHSSDNSLLEKHAALSTTPAVKNGAVIRMDGLLMLGFGPRTGEAITKLSTAIYSHEF